MKKTENSSSDRFNFLVKVYDEIDRQNVIWDRKIWDDEPHKKLTVLAEEFGEVARGVLEHDDENVMEELVQVAALCFQWGMSFDT